ncbi:hypothetical protein FACS1894172_06840 [Spirochaetia bacterium]|nr:hypothetical protein FACS1894164_15800 [Spirochaetia bacterium]GHU31624.1 hypothetical protein FACS1894172_06840 [Spirochaetia bacterium]
MKNNTTNFSKMGIVLLLIGVLGILNTIGDIVTLILMITQSFEGNTFFSFFFRVFADKQLFFIAGTLTLICNILFLVFMFGRKSFLFQLFFFASCIIALIHLLVNLFALYPLTIFDIMVNANISHLIISVIVPMLGLLKATYPMFLVTSIFASLGLLIVCFIYFKRSERIATYFSSTNSV